MIRWRRRVPGRPGGAPDDHRSRKVARQLAAAVVLANLAGALVVYVFLVFLLPLGDRAGHQRALNTVLFVLYLLGGGALGLLAGHRAARPLLAWLRSTGEAGPAERRAVLRQPWRQTQVSAAVWAVAALVFGGVNTAYDPGVAFDVAITVALGGFTTCGLTYLLSERLLRPVVTEVMAASPDPPPVLLGVGRRIVLAWALSSAVPLLGIGLGVLVPTGAHAPLGPTGIGFLVAAGLVAGLLATTAAAAAVSDPVRSVAAALREVGSGRLDVAVPVYDASEVGQLQSGFNRMVAQLQERDRLRDLFGRQVGDDVARLALERGVQLGGEVRDVAALFVDVIGSTRLALTTEPQEVVRRLNEFFTAVVEVVTAYGGMVNKFEGDGALCLFGAPVEREDSRAAALAAARELAARLAPLALEAAIGVAAGPAVVGHVGASSRFEYTALGDPVNSSARLSELAKGEPSRVLADAAVVRTAGPAEARRWRVGEEVLLRGRDRPTRLARPVR